MRTSALVAPLVIDGAINREMFVAYVKNILIEELKTDDVVILDNLSSHKRSETREAIESEAGTTSITVATATVILTRSRKAQSCHRG